MRRGWLLEAWLTRAAVLDQPVHESEELSMDSFFVYDCAPAKELGGGVVSAKSSYQATTSATEPLVRQP